MRREGAGSSRAGGSAAVCTGEADATARGATKRGGLALATTVGTAARATTGRGLGRGILVDLALSCSESELADRVGFFAAGFCFAAWLGFADVGPADARFAKSAFVDCAGVATAANGAASRSTAMLNVVMVRRRGR